MDATFLFGIAVGLVVVGGYLVQRRRAAMIRALAARSGYHYLGTSLPRSLTLDGTPFSYLSAVWNVIDGEPRGPRIVAFDCRVGIGKGSWRQTVIAIEGDGEFPDSSMFDLGYTVDRSGRWKILYRPKNSIEMRIGGLTTVAELEACLNSLPIGYAALKGLDSQM